MEKNLKIVQSTNQEEAQEKDQIQSKPFLNAIKEVTSYLFTEIIAQNKLYAILVVDKEDLEGRMTNLTRVSNVKVGPQLQKNCMLNLSEVYYLLTKSEISSKDDEAIQNDKLKLTYE